MPENCPKRKQSNDAICNKDEPSSCMLRAIAKEQDFGAITNLRRMTWCLYYQINQHKKKPIPPITEKQERKPVHPVKIISHPQEMEKLEEKEMARTRSIINNHLK